MGNINFTIMKIAKYIVLAALLGLMTETEVVEAVQMHSHN